MNKPFPFSLIDLTHTLDETIPTWAGGCGFQHHIQSDYNDCQGDVKFRVGQLTMNAGIGTHIDAPAHCIAGGLTIEQIPLSQLLAPCIVIDVSEYCDERYQISIKDIKKFETHNFLIPQGAFVMIKTGWERFWHNPEKYRNQYQFPSVSIEAASLLIERNVCGLGIDTLSPIVLKMVILSHQSFLQAGKYLVENAANLQQLPLVGSFIMPIPIKVKHATEAPIQLWRLFQTK